MRVGDSSELLTKSGTIVIILKLSVTCFSNVVKYNTYGKFALKK